MIISFIIVRLSSLVIIELEIFTTRAFVYFRLQEEELPQNILINFAEKEKVHCVVREQGHKVISSLGNEML